MQPRNSVPKNHDMIRNNDILITESECLDDVSIRQSELEQNPKLLPKEPKKHMHPLILFINICMMLAPGTFTVGMLLWTTKDLQLKAYYAMGLISLGALGMVLTCWNLKVGPKKLFEAAIIMDNILISVALTTVAFFGMMKFLERGKWEMKMLEAAFQISIFVMMVNIRVILLYMKWKRIEVLIYKFFLYVMALEFLIFGVYCFYVNHSFTFNILKKFDQQCRFFIMLYTFAAFDFSVRILKLFSNFDYTEKFKYAYVIKSVQHEVMETKKEVVKTLRCFPGEKYKQKEREVHFIPAVRVDERDSVGQ